MMQLQTGAEIHQWWSVSGLTCQMVSAGIVPKATQERASGTKVSSQNHVFLCRSGFCLCISGLDNTQYQMHMRRQKLVSIQQLRCVLTNTTE